MALFSVFFWMLDPFHLFLVYVSCLFHSQLRRTEIQQVVRTLFEFGNDLC
jgi:hypothetical protein